jgi:hypothetical protein
MIMVKSLQHMFSAHSSFSTVSQQLEPNDFQFFSQLTIGFPQLRTTFSRFIAQPNTSLYLDDSCEGRAFIKIDSLES